jgi:excisionase family DNA binding protein
VKMVEMNQSGAANAEISQAAIERLLTPNEVAKILNVSYGWVKDHAGRKKPHIPCVRLGGLLRFRPEDVEEFIKTWCQ